MVLLALCERVLVLLALRKRVLVFLALRKRVQVFYLFVSIVSVFIARRRTHLRSGPLVDLRVFVQFSVIAVH